MTRSCRESGTDGRAEAATKERAGICGVRSAPAGQGTGRDRTLSAGTVQESGGTGLDGRGVSGSRGRGGFRPPGIHDRDRRDFAMLRFDGRDPERAEFAVLRSHPSLWNRGAEEEVSAAVHTGRKNRVLRADGAASGLECGGAANEGG